MAESTASAPGRLVVEDSVFEKIALGAALTVDSVVRIDESGAGRLGSLINRDTTVGAAYPRASVESAGGAAHVVDVTIAVTWPSPIARVCRDVRSRVGDELLRLTGNRPLRVNVTVARVVPKSRRVGNRTFVELPDPDGPGTVPDRTEPDTEVR